MQYKTSKYTETKTHIDDQLNFTCSDCKFGGGRKERNLKLREKRVKERKFNFFPCACEFWKEILTEKSILLF